MVEFSIGGFFLGIQTDPAAPGPSPEFFPLNFPGKRGRMANSAPPPGKCPVPGPPPASAKKEYNRCRIS